MITHDVHKHQLFQTKDAKQWDIHREETADDLCHSNTSAVGKRAYGGNKGQRKEYHSSRRRCADYCEAYGHAWIQDWTN